MLALRVRQQVAGLTVEGFTELRQGLGVDALSGRFPHEVVDGLACEPRRRGEGVACKPCLGGHLFERPANRHDGKIALTERLDNRQSSVYYAVVPQWSAGMEDVITCDGLEYEVRVNEAGEILCDLCDGPTANLHGVCDRCLPSACATLLRAVTACLDAMTSTGKSR